LKSHQLFLASFITLNNIQIFSGDIHYVPNVNHTEPEPTPVTTLPRPAVADPQDELPVCTSTPLPQTNETLKLSNPKRGSSAASAYGYMFDLVSKNPSQSIHIKSFDLYFKVESCDYKLWSKKGNSNTDPSNTNWFPLWMEPDYWCLIGEGRLTQQGGNPTWGDRTPMVSGEHFVGQTIEPGQSRAFYVNFFNCSSNWPSSLSTRGINLFGNSTTQLLPLNFSILLSLNSHKAFVFIKCKNATFLLVQTITYLIALAAW